MSIMSIFLVCVGVATLFFAGASFVFARQSKDWKDYLTSALQVFLGVVILAQVWTRV
jgi:hypothetical protein